jgi:hypothetical protein
MCSLQTLFSTDSQGRETAKIWMKFSSRMSIKNDLRWRRVVQSPGEIAKVGTRRVVGGMVFKISNVDRETLLVKEVHRERLQRTFRFHQHPRVAFGSKLTTSDLCWVLNCGEWQGPRVLERTLGERL